MAPAVLSGCGPQSPQACILSMVNLSTSGRGELSPGSQHSSSQQMFTDSTELSPPPTETNAQGMFWGFGKEPSVFLKCHLHKSQQSHCRRISVFLETLKLKLSWGLNSANQSEFSLFHFLPPYFLPPHFPLSLSSHTHRPTPSGFRPDG